MSAGDRDTLALTELLNKHRHNLGVCTCGYGEGKRWGIDEVLHRAHVADVLLASDWLREQRAEAWDEGLGVGSGMARIYGHTDHWPDVEPTNPYRTTEDTESSNNG